MNTTECMKKPTLGIKTRFAVLDECETNNGSMFSFLRRCFAFFLPVFYFFVGAFVSFILKIELPNAFFTLGGGIAIVCFFVALCSFIVSISKGPEEDFVAFMAIFSNLAIASFSSLYEIAG